MKHIGFTGTRDMLPEERYNSLTDYLKKCLLTEGAYLHHGDCIGSDAMAHMIATTLGYKIHIHPPINESARAFCNGDVMHKAKDYLDRNKDIVNVSDLLIAMPKNPKMEELKSGTWSTVRYAKRNDKEVIII